MRPNWLGPAIAPGENLLEEYLKPMGIGQLEAARRLGISLNRLNEIVLGKRGIAADTTLRLSRLRKTSPQLWMRLQADWHLHQAIVRERKASLRADGRMLFRNCVGRSRGSHHSEDPGGIGWLGLSIDSQQPATPVNSPARTVRWRNDRPTSGRCRQGSSFAS